MTFKYNNVYINSYSTIVGPYEARGPLKKYFDKYYTNLYCGEKSWELAEVKLLKESVDFLLARNDLLHNDIDIHISGDLLNQLTSTSYSSSYLNIPLVGIYSACATSVEGMILASNMIDAGQVSNAIVSTSSHNNAAEKQFRQPVEYGGPKKRTSTFTATGGASLLLSNNKDLIRVESSTLGRVNNSNIKDVNHMGAVMAIAAGDTLRRHLKDLNRNVNYYDLILTGDLGIFGKKILIDYMKEFGIKLTNYDDSACMLYDLNKQKVYAGASGPVCLPLVTYTYIFKEMKKRKLKRVLLIATGSLHSLSMVNQKQTIPSIAHAISLEVS